MAGLIAGALRRRNGGEPAARTGRTAPFAGFEWLIAGRYLRARRRGGGGLGEGRS